METISTAVKEKANTMNHSWLQTLDEQIASYLNSLQVEGQIGRYRPANQGLTQHGESIALGMSCYAHKIYYMLGLWDNLSVADQQTWNKTICDFQVSGKPIQTSPSHNAFIDSTVIDYLHKHTQAPPKYTIKQEAKRIIKRILRRTVPQHQTYVEAVLRAETKQAIATLAEVGVSPARAYQGYPDTEYRLNNYLHGLNWKQPWSAGAHAATVSVFLTTIGEETQDLRNIVSRFIQNTLDKETGAYYRGGSVPEHGTLVNGAMKVLTALDWLEEPVHLPEQLIDTTLSKLPAAEGCHVVDAVYVLYRCSLQTDHRKADIQQFCQALLKVVKAHLVPEEGGFSYFVGKSQTSYYRVPITQGLPVADLHGTILFTWALAMIFVLLDDESLPQWRVIRP